jgi:ATP-binding cassette, subfamily B (MDR/TAP), member 1
MILQLFILHKWHCQFLIVCGRSLGNATPCLAAFAEGQSAAYRLFTTVKRKPEINSDNPTGKQLEDIKGDVELKDVYFSYPARPKQLIFGGFSLHVSRGTTMAIVGESGSGKSTVISLVQRFYELSLLMQQISSINYLMYITHPPSLKLSSV